MLRRTDEALIRYQRAVAIHREVADLQHVATTLGNIAILRFELGDLVGARRSTEEAIELAERTGEHSYDGFGHLQLAFMLRAQGDLDGARRAASTGLTVARELGERPHVAQGLAESGLLAAHAGHWDEAERLLGESTRTYRDSGDEETALFNNVALAEMALGTGQAARAETLARELVGWLEAHPADPEDTVRAHEVLARALLAQRRMAPARAALERALATPAAQLSFDVRMHRLLTQARLEAADGRAAAAKRHLEQLRAETHRTRFRELELQARLAVLELGLVKRSVARSQGKALRKEAAGLGFSVIAGRAAALSG
jgi:tetratricopeptide (TPR) repeat protein